MYEYTKQHIIPYIINDIYNKKATCGYNKKEATCGYNKWVNRIGAFKNWKEIGGGGGGFGSQRRRREIDFCWGWEGGWGCGTEPTESWMSGSVGSNYWVSPLISDASCPHQIPPPYTYLSPDFALHCTHYQTKLKFVCALLGPAYQIPKYPRRVIGLKGDIRSFFWRWSFNALCNVHTICHYQKKKKNVHNNMYPLPK